jgi:hypothetical protein
MTSDSINAQRVFIPHRVLDFNLSRNDTLVVHAIDPQGLPLSYSWRWGKWMLGSDSVLVLDRFKKLHSEEESSVTVTISNGADSTVLDWRFVDTSITFTSFPSTTVVSRGDWFAYRPKASSQHDEHPRISIVSAPAWLSLDRFGKLTGRADTMAGAYRVTLSAMERHGRSATQSFTINVVNGFADVTTPVSDAGTLRICPNPFYHSAEVQFDCPQDAVVTAELCTATGIVVRRLCTNKRFSGGACTLRIEAIDAEGELATGAYLCRLSIRTSDGKECTVVRAIRRL